MFKAYAPVHEMAVNRKFPGRPRPLSNIRAGGPDPALTIVACVQSTSLLEHCSEQAQAQPSLPDNVKLPDIQRAMAFDSTRAEQACDRRCICLPVGSQRLPPAIQIKSLGKSD